MNDVIPSIELYDSDIPPIEKVLEAINRSQKKNVNLESFRKEIIQRFDEIGLVVQVKVYETNQADVYAFDIDIYDRHEVREFDYDKQSYEVVNDILGIEPEKKGMKIEVPNDPRDIHSEEKHNH